MNRSAAATLGFTWCLCFSQLAFSQWQTAADTPPGMAESIEVAMVGNQTGDSFQVYRNTEGEIRAVLILRDGFETFDQSSCPTYRIDNAESTSVTVAAETCRLEARRAHFSLGKVADGTVHSDTLVALQDGTEIEFMVHLRALGYRATRFTLSRSKKILATAIGSDIVILPR